MVHNGDFVISSDDKTMLYQVKTEADPLLRSDLWRAEITETGWRDRDPAAFAGQLPLTTTRATRPTRPEGTVYFFSNRPGGKGRFDLYALPVQGRGSTATPPTWSP